MRLPLGHCGSKSLGCCFDADEICARARTDVHLNRVFCGVNKGNPNLGVSQAHPILDYTNLQNSVQIDRSVH